MSRITFISILSIAILAAALSFEFQNTPSGEPDKPGQAPRAEPDFYLEQAKSAEFDAVLSFFEAWRECTPHCLQHGVPRQCK